MQNSTPRDLPRRMADALRMLAVDAVERAKVAEAMGCTGIRVEKPAQVIGPGEV